MFFKDNFYPLLKLAIPLALTGLLQSTVFFFETLFLAHLGSEVLAAGALVAWLFATFAVILFGILSSINILVAHQYGANNKLGISLIVRDGLWLALLLTAPAFLLFWNMSPLFLLVGQSPAVVALAEPYLHALAWGLLPNFMMIALLEIIIGFGHARLILLFSIFSVSLTIFFSFTLIFGKFGLPALGIAGAGWGVTVSSWIAVIFIGSYILIDKNYRPYFRYLFRSTKQSYLLELLRVGTPMGIMYCVEVAFFFVLTLCMGSLSSQVLAANQIALQYLGLLISVIFSIAQAITVRMGHLIGAGDVTSAKQAAYAGMCISASFMLLVAIVYWYFPTALISIDFDIHNAVNSDIVRFAVQFLTISAIFQIVEAIRISLFGALRGLKDTHFTLFVSILSFWGIALPSGYLLAIYLGIGGIGFWWGMVLGAGFSVLMLLRRFKSKIELYIKKLPNS